MQTDTYWAVVTDNADPEKLNRVRVSKVGEEPGLTEWLSVLTPYASNDAGLSFIPEIGDQVMVVNLDIEGIHKAVFGTMWFNKALPPETGENTEADLNKNGKNALRFIKSRSGSQLIFDDTEGKEKIQLISADNKTRFELNVEESSTNLTTEHDIILGAKNKITIQGEKLELISDNITNTCEDGEIQDDAKGKIEIKSNDITADGQGISLN